MPPQIEKNIPIPEKWHLSSRELMLRMEIGDSLLLKTAGMCASLRTHTRLKNPDWKFTVRKMEDGYRMWRVE
jgi:hypothetical protein